VGEYLRRVTSGNNILDAAVGLCHDGSRGIWSLLDLTRYCVRDLHALLIWMDHMCNYTRSQEQCRQGLAAALKKGEKESIVQHTACVRKHCIELELTDTANACDALVSGIEGMTLGECRGHLASIRRMVTDALRKRIFMYVPVRLAEYAQLLERPVSVISPAPTAPLKPLGEKTFEVFPEARYDAEQMALCMVSGATTAAVFHMMRVVEWGVRALGADLGLRRLEEKTRTGTKRTPIENVTWGRISTQLRAKADRRLHKLRPGPSKDKKQRFYASAFMGSYPKSVMRVEGL
jgi:hypothetical protein